jgi:hypothetical protein
MMAPQVTLMADAVMVRALSETTNAATLPTSSSGRAPAQQGGRHQGLDQRIATLEVGANRVDHTAGQQRHHPDAVPAELARQLLRSASTAVRGIWKPPML